MDNNITGKICTRCNEYKSLDLYCNHKSGKYGKYSYCKKCASDIASSYYHKDKDSIREKNRKYAKDYRTNNKEHYRWKRKEFVYKKLGINITKEEYDLLYHKSYGLCAICGRENTEGKTLALDHCHKTNKIRGFLCDKCNTALGMFQDNILILRKAIKYLELHSQDKFFKNDSKN